VPVGSIIRIWFVIINVLEAARARKIVLIAPIVVGKVGIYLNADASEEAVGKILTTSVVFDDFIYRCWLWLDGSRRPLHFLWE
jgi:hypothetical protein